MSQKTTLLNLSIVRFTIYLFLLLPLIYLREPTKTNEDKYFKIADEQLIQQKTLCNSYHGEVYAEKPPLYFWLIRMTTKAVGNTPTRYTIMTFFSVIPAFLILFIFGEWCKKEIKGRYRYAAELALLTTAWFLGSALVLRMDMLMALFITLAMKKFWKIYSEKHSKVDKFMFGFWIFMAVFTKGPVGFLMPFVCTTVFLLVKQQGRIFWKMWDTYTLLPIIVGCGLWWSLTALEGGMGYLGNMLLHQTFGRAVNSFSHARSIFYYLYSMWYILAPWSILTFGIILWAIISKKVQLSDLTQFFIVTSFSFILMMSLFSCKLQIYLLPCIGFVTYATFLILYKMATTNHELHSAARTLRKVMMVGSAVVLTAVFLVSVAATDWVNETIMKIDAKNGSNTELVAAPVTEGDQSVPTELPGNQD